MKIKIKKLYIKGRKWIKNLQRIEDNTINKVNTREVKVFVLS